MAEHVRAFTGKQSNKQKAQMHDHILDGTDAKPNALAGYTRLPLEIGKRDSASNADIHAGALKRVTPSHSPHADRLLLQLQRQYGNRYVQRVVGLAQKSRNETASAPWTDLSMQRTYSSKFTPDGNMHLQMKSVHRQVSEQVSEDGLEGASTSTQRLAGQISPRTAGVLARFPSPADCHTFRPGLSYMNPVIKEGYDGKAFTAIKTGWEVNSWERRWRIYDADDQLLYESYYTWPQPTLYIPQDVIAKGKAKGIKKPWSVWIKVTKTLVPLGGSDPGNFPHSYMKFYVYNTWNEYMADPTAKLSTAEKPDESSKKATPLDTASVSGARSVTDYGSVVAMHEAYLREIYDTAAKGITETAKEAVAKGAPQGEVAKWATEARNQLKAKIRADGNPILEKVFEARNLNKYGNKLGPTYEQLYQKYAKQGLSPEEINKKIIGSSGRANLKVNRWSGRLKVAGRILLAIDIALAGVRVYLTPEGQKTRVALEEMARIGGALALGAAGAKAGAAAGAAIGALFGGAGAVPGAIIGGLIGGLAGAIFGGWLGQSIVDKLFEMFPPADCVFEGEFAEEER